MKPLKALNSLAAPAKLNLFLHITGRRADGYHLLQSAFMLIDWCDSLHFELRPGPDVSREDLAHALPKDDLILRAARALQQATGTTLGAHIRVEKRIPTQAGMGGGSSDAATTLLALRRLWGLQLGLDQLKQIGLTLGADLPFFLYGRDAWVEGIGERISPLSLPPCQVLVVKPPAGLATEAIFSDARLKRDSITATISGFAADPFGFGRNDLQPVAQSLCPQISQALEWLAAQGLRGRMTGSGSAVFAWAPPGFKAPQAPEGFEAKLCQSLEVHPLAKWAADVDFFGQ
jgi:4-diphosphocytidyl-2-C-methyl-D-erythritol kinase